VEDAIPQGIPSGGLQTGHEKTAIQARGLVISAGVLVGVVIVCQLMLAWWMQGFKSEEQQLNALHPARQEIPVDQFPNPRLQERPPVDLVQVQREERTHASSYGWVDKKAGIARIPVDRAMDILAQKGLPKVAAKPRTPGAPPNTSIPPAGKREEAGSGENPPAPATKADRPHPETKGGGTP
jgi:hypothetical protein